MILGLTGKMGSGKDTACARLKELSPIKVIQVSFARKLKESVCELFGISLDQVEYWKNVSDVCVSIGARGDFSPRIRTFPDTEMTFRQFLQQYGTEAHRHVFGDDFWLDAAMPLSKDYSDALYVVTDVRFPNEAARVRSLGGTLVLIEGPETDTGSHASEAGLTDHDWHIDNRARYDNFENLDAELDELLRHAWDKEYV